MAATSMMLVIVMVAIMGMAGGQQPECREGEVRDLDGTCVKKVTFPPREKKSCPDIAIPG
jgi:hypothetical protein